MKLLIYSVLTLALLSEGCQKISKSFGGNTTINLPQGRKLVNATWDEGSDFWSVTRASKAEEHPETFIVYESSTFGVLQGTVTIIEH